jgi:fructosamine-3-kinase
MASNTSLLDSIRAGLSDALGENPRLEWVRNLPGGDINRAALIRTKNSNWFVKYNRAAPDGMFAAEALALDTIARQECIRVPSPVTHGTDGNTAWLVLEYLELTSSGPAALLGEQLAALHSVEFGQFGWRHDNFIGTTSQRNTNSNNWLAFWRDNRLKPQFKMAQTAGFGTRLADKGENLLQHIHHFMQDHKPVASLLHGDLWAGNKAFTQDGQPVLFDPASYYGDRETDIAMTELFGGFDSAFYSAYTAHCPLPDGYQLRRDLYNLYHMLNHLNLFGAGYLSRCENIIDHLMAQIR